MNNKNLTIRKERLQLSPYILFTLREYERDGILNFQDFIISSTANFLEHISGEISRENIGEMELEGTIPISVSFPLPLSRKLRRLYSRIKTSKSEIIHEALGYSISMLMDLLETMEDYMFELAEFKDRTE